MLKRKRGPYEAKRADPARAAQLKRQGVEWTFTKARKSLTKALKAAKGFERQKLGTRRRIATEKQDNAKREKLMLEIEALKSLDLSVLVESYLRKSLLKSKSISESPLLPETLKGDLSKKNTALPDSLAISNVRARLYNTKPVKEAMFQIMDSFYSILNIPNPTPAPKIMNKLAIDSPGPKGNEEERLMARSSPEKQNAGDIRRAHATEDHTTEDHVEPTLKALGSDSESKSHSENLSRYDQRIGDSENTLNNEGEVGKESLIEHNPEATRNPSISISDGSRSPSPPRHRKKSSKQAPPLKSASTFLPTLMGGYWSGSESATDDEDAPAPKKNRPGQQERRAMWERIYGANAYHLKDPASTKVRDKDWDTKRGARSRDDRERRRGGGGGSVGRGNFLKGREPATGDNAVAVKRRARGIGKKDDTGPLHPSWEAAKKAKEAKQTAKFQGKKVVFD